MLPLGAANTLVEGPERSHPHEIGGAAGRGLEIILTQNRGAPADGVLRRQGRSREAHEPGARCSQESGPPPRSITTAASHVVHVQRSLPSSARSAVTFPARAKAAPSPSRRVAPRRERMRSTSRSFDPLEVIFPQVRRGRGSFLHRGRFCPQRVNLSLDVHRSQGLAF